MYELTVHWANSITLVVATDNESPGSRGMPFESTQPANVCPSRTGVDPLNVYDEFDATNPVLGAFVPPVAL